VAYDNYLDDVIIWNYTVSGFKRGLEKAGMGSVPACICVLNSLKFRLLPKHLLKSLGISTPRSPHYHVLGPSLICLSPQVSLATKYLASHKYSIEYHYHTVSLDEHQQSSTHNSRECF
jgi:hypothetical protein